MRKTCFALILTLSSLIAEDSQEVLSLIKSYEESLNSKDSQKVSEVFTRDSEFELPRTGKFIEGNKDIAEFLIQRMKESPNLKISFKDLKVELKDNNRAIATGTVQFENGGNNQEKIARKIELIKQDGKWLIDRTSEIAIANPPDLYEHLKPLEWLIGNWRDDSGEADIRFENNWDRTKNYIVQKFSSKIYENEEIEGLQIIGWDPEQKKIRSWIFDSDGGFGGGYWTKSGSDWQQEISYTLSDGRRASALNIFKPKDRDTYEYSSIHREVAGIALPDIEAVEITREKS